jgi:hypothetical protein
MIQLRNKQNGVLLGRIDEEDLKLLVDQLEEESETDTDYYINRPTLETLRANGASERLLHMLELGMGDADDVEVEWSRHD